MSKIRIIISLIFAVLVFSKGNAANNLNYDDIYQVILTGDKDKAYTLLMAYQKQDPDFANTYFQLAIIAKDWAKEFNPFTEFAYTKLFIYNTKLYFNLAKLKLNDEKKKNRIYYENVGITTGENKLSFEDILLFVDSQVNEVEVYETNIVKIIHFFNKSSDSYNECVDIFMNINSEYSKIKNIYLAEEDDFISKINELESGFDSTLIYFQKYKNATNKYPIKGYNQKYKLREIITYRLDGLTNSNFLNNEFALWDYKKWVEGIKKTKGERIKNNRSDIVSVETNMKSIIQQLSNDEYSDNYKPYKLDDKFVYKIEKYDNNSMLIKLFKLNEAKINYLTSFRKAINNPKSTDNYSLVKNAAYYYMLYEKRMFYDSLNSDFAANIKPEEIKKYKNFYLSYYTGVQGLKDYSLRQDLFIKEKHKEADKNLKKRLYSSFFDLSSKTLSYKSEQINIVKNFPDFNVSNENSYNICDFKKSDDNKIWTSGYYKTKDSKIQAFSAFSEDMKTVKFLKKTQKSDTSNLVNLLTEPFPEGSFVLETNIGNHISNTLIKYNNKGVVVSKTKILISKIPRYMKYDDINNSIIIVLNGNNLDATKDTDNEQVVYHINFDDESKSYIVRYKSKSYIFEIISLNNKILLFSNFVDYIDIDNKKVVSKAGNSAVSTNVLVTVLSNGLIKKQIPLFYKKPFFGVKAVKLNSNLINVLAYKTNYTNKNFNSLKKENLLSLFLNSDVEEVYSPWHD